MSEHPEQTARTYHVLGVPQQDMPAAYFPHTDGLTLAEGTELLGALLRDPRLRIIEVTEYAALRDLDQRCIGKLVDLLAEGLRE